MSYEGMAGLRATLGDVSALTLALDDGEWATPSAAAGGGAERVHPAWATRGCRGGTR
jgi:hypothetical protein